MRMSSNLIIIAEQRAGVLNRASWEAIAAAQQLQGDQPITIVLPGSQVSAAATELATAIVKDVVTLEHQALEAYTADGFTAALQPLLEELSPAFVVLPHTYQTRDLA